MTSPRWNVLVVEDMDMVLSHIINLLPDILPCSAVTGVRSIAEALEHIRIQPPDLLITDIWLPGSGDIHDGIDLVEDMSEFYPKMKILVMSMYCKQIDLLCARDAGAHGFYAKPKAGEIFVDAIITITNGEQYFPDMVRDSMLSGFTAKDKKILRLQSMGTSNQIICSRLKIAEKTLINRQDNIRRKMGFKTSSEYKRYITSLA